MQQKKLGKNSLDKREFLFSHAEQGGLLRILSQEVLPFLHDFDDIALCEALIEDCREYSQETLDKFRDDWQRRRLSITLTSDQHRRLWRFLRFALDIPQLYDRDFVQKFMRLLENSPVITSRPLPRVWQRPLLASKPKKRKYPSWYP